MSSDSENFGTRHEPHQPARPLNAVVSYERRIGERVPANSFALTLVHAVPRGKRRRRVHRFDATVVDLSITGAGIVTAGAEKLVGLGTIVGIEIQGATGEAEITRVVAIERPDHRTFYGLRFVALSNELHQLISEIVASSRKRFDWKWYAAR
jgi:hypothetical protein